MKFDILEMPEREGATELNPPAAPAAMTIAPEVTGVAAGGSIEGAPDVNWTFAFVTAVMSIGVVGSTPEKAVTAATAGAFAAGTLHVSVVSGEDPMMA